MKSDKKRTWAEIYLDRLSYNINAIKSVSGGLELMAVVKADAYGHGDLEICRHLRKLGIRFFAVSNIDEAMDVRSVCDDAEIFILGYSSPEFAPELAEADIIQGIISPDNALAFSLAAGKANKTLRCHIKLDTGMGRIGLKYATPEECASAVTQICKLPSLSVEGIYTHYAVADSNAPEDIAYTKAQTEYISKVFELTNKILAPKSLRHMHCLNSAGLCGSNQPVGTLARVGIIMYGLYPNYPLELPISLKPVMELKSTVGYIKEAECGDYISYGRTFRAERKMKIATLPIGYADGYPRALSSHGNEPAAYVVINGKRCNIIGRVCMDQLMCDITDAGDIRVGDVVTLFGGKEAPCADMLAAQCGTIGYELVCGISKRVPRIYTSESDS